jgi:putative membrane protein
MSDKSKHDMAEHRTDWAHERTLLAKERTFSAWGRTGISAMAAGLAIARLLSSVESPWVARMLGVALIFTGGMIYALGFLSYRNALRKLAKEGVRSTPLWVIGVITLLLMFSTVLALLLIFER